MFDMKLVKVWFVFAIQTQYFHRYYLENFLVHKSTTNSRPVIQCMASWTTALTIFGHLCRTSNYLFDLLIHRLHALQIQSLLYEVVSHSHSAFVDHCHWCIIGCGTTIISLYFESHAWFIRNGKLILAY